jgi:hypothetical protein
MKNKLVLSIIAVAACMTLAISGTLMLFTAQSEIATNIVTVGRGVGGINGEEMKLQEKDEDEGGYDYQNLEEVYIDHFEHGTYGTTDGKFKGLNFGEVYPAAVVTKKPRVARFDTDGVDAYLRVKAELTVRDADGDPVDWNIDLTPAQQKIILDIWRDGTDITSKWRLISTPDSALWYYYYVLDNKSAPDSLETFSKAILPAVINPTTDIFTTITVPNYSKSALYPADDYAALETLAKYQISLKLTAQAVQKDNNNPVPPTNLWDYFSDSAFN